MESPRRKVVVLALPLPSRAVAIVPDTMSLAGCVCPSFVDTAIELLPEKLAVSVETLLRTLDMQRG